jgi:hypothetical protein
LHKKDGKRVKKVIFSITFLFFDEVVKSQKSAFYVIPVKAGIDPFRMVMDSGSSPE